MRKRFAFACVMALIVPPGAHAVDNVLPVSVANCVDSQAPVRFGPTDLRAGLDAADGLAVAAAIVARYPMLERDGHAPDRVALWQKPGSGWIYLGLRADPSKPGGACVSATFAADRFALTESLLRKYFGIGGPRT